MYIFLPPVPRTFKRSKSFIVTCRDLVGDGSVVEGTTEFAVTSLRVELVTWLLGDGIVIVLEEMAVPLQITPEK